jgi:lantibiotic modifying enzyme
LAWTAEQAVTWEMSVAKSAWRVSRDLEPERDLQRYFFSSGVTKEALRLLKNYPALARLWAVQIEFWQRYVRDFLEHSVSFARGAGIRAKGAPIISSIDLDLSDPHEGNRSVLRVNFAKPWFYKPRPGGQERAWFELLGWINARGFPRPFRTLNINCEDRYCWMESVRARPCRNEKEALLFCFRAGALMCLIHLLRGVDFHPENLIVAGPHPVVIDCETLLHPATSLPEYARAEDASIRRTGMLMLAKRIPAGILGWQGKDDRMLKEIIGGFQAMHEFARRDGSLRYLQKWLRGLRKVPARNIYRPTAHYHALLSQSLAPSLLTGGLERSLYLHACCRDGTNPSERMGAEVAALQNADIPVFRSKPRRVPFDLSEATLKKSIVMIRVAFESTARLPAKSYQGNHEHR